ncbi:redoxin domain-containing protein [Thermoleophilia bacterium SCSIO 60948]|nr:redoxin domain-containing protein [Thermoleophilia bacterium SCSIO 60948]
MIEVGAEAPRFVMPDQDGHEFRLADHIGRRILLVFYPADFSPACTDQLSVLEEVRPEFEAARTAVLGISADSQWAHRAFCDQLGLGMTLLSDFHPKGAVAAAYGAYLEDRGHPSRALVLIGEDGRVEWTHESDDPSRIPGVNLIFDALAGR